MGEKKELSFKDKLTVALGTIDRSGHPSEYYNDKELEVLLKINPMLIPAIRTEEKKRLGLEEKKEERIKPTKELFIRVKNVIKKYLDTTELNYNLLSLWILGTHFHEEFETFPLLLLNARKRAGKTRTLKLTSSLAKGGDGSTSTSVTETFLFRHKEGAVFFDEMESISSKDKTALRETINAVYKKGNKIVRYTEKKVEGKKQYVEECFFPYYPLGLANVQGFGDILADRSIQIILQRSEKKQTKLIEDFSTNYEIKSLKEKLSNLEIQLPYNIFSEWNSFVEGGEVNKELEELFKSIGKTGISGRPLELFFPLFLVAEQFSVLNLAISSSLEYIEQQEGEFVDSADDLLQNFMDNSNYIGFTPASRILNDFKNSLEEPEQWMNSKWFGRALKRLGLISKKRIVNGRVQILLNNNTTNTTNTTNSTNSTNTTKKQVESVEFVEFKGLVDNIIIPSKELPDLNENETKN